MKRILALLLASLAAIPGILAQGISAELFFDREQYLLGEELVVRLHITNYYGQTLTLGNRADWLTFAVEGGPSRSVHQTKPVELPGEFKLESAKVAKVPVVLTPAFDLQEPGRYTVSATVQVPQVNGMVRAKPVSFNLITGTLLWQQEFGAPLDPKATNQARASLRYALLQITTDKGLKVYSRLTDAKGARIYRVEEIGSLASISNVEAQIDQFSNLHVLFQNGRIAYLYSLINPDGFLLVRETYDIANKARPTLRSLDNGRITVVGGQRRYASTDLPPVSPGANSRPPAAAEEPKPTSPKEQ